MNVKPDAVLAPALVVVGSANVDLTAFVDRLPTAGETVAGGRLSRDLGGKGANQAVAAAKLGGRVRMVGAVGADAATLWVFAANAPSIGFYESRGWQADGATRTQSDFGEPEQRMRREWA